MREKACTSIRIKKEIKPRMDLENRAQTTATQAWEQFIFAKY